LRAERIREKKREGGRERVVNSCSGALVLEEADGKKELKGRRRGHTRFDGSV
jgi:hypothetical protein